jgi:hypothetical protein
VADRVTGVELPRQRYTACGELPNLNLVGHFQDPGVTKKGHQRVCDQHAGGPGCAENRGGSGAPFVVPCRLSGGGSRGRAYAIPEVEGSSDAADKNLRIRGFRYQSSRSHRYLSVELSPIHGQHMGITAPSAKPSNCFAARMFRDSVGK